MNFNPFSDRIFLWGMPGSGKSTFGRNLAKQLHCAFTDLDVHIEHTAGKTIPQIFREKGEDEFRRMEHEALLQVMKSKHGIIATGGGTPCFFEQAGLMKESGLTIFLDVPVAVLAKRVAGRSGRPLLDKSDDQTTRLRELRDSRLPFYEMADITIKKETADLLDQIDRYFSR